MDNLPFSSPNTACHNIVIGHYCTNVATPRSTWRRNLQKVHISQWKSRNPRIPFGKSVIELTIAIKIGSTISTDRHTQLAQCVSMFNPWPQRHGFAPVRGSCCHKPFPKDRLAVDFDYSKVSFTSTNISLTRSNDVCEKVVNVSVLLAAEQQLHPHDAIFLKNGDIVSAISTCTYDCAYDGLELNYPIVFVWWFSRCGWRTSPKVHKQQCDTLNLSILWAKTVRDILVVFGVIRRGMGLFGIMPCNFQLFFCVCDVVCRHQWWFKAQKTLRKKVLRSTLVSEWGDCHKVHIGSLFLIV